MMVLGDVQPGTYSFKLTVGAGTLTDVRAIDGEGETIGSPAGSLKAGSGEQVVAIQVKEAAYGVSLWAFTEDTKVAVAYNVTYAATSPSMAGGRLLRGAEVWAGMLTSVLAVMYHFLSL